MEPTPPAPGDIERLAPAVRRILAPNPSPMTHWGTNTFVLGEGDVTVIDPGPDDPTHAKAVLAGLEPGERIARILVTHAHNDHSPLARPLAEATGARIYAFGPAGSGRSALMQELAAQGLVAGGEGIDRDFAPDVPLEDGEEIDIGHGLTLETLRTPGHFASHLSFALGDAIFTGDHVMGWASTFISPPDGDLTGFMASCERLLAREARLLHPAHGAPIPDPASRLTWLMEHRRAREAQILAALAPEPATIPALTRQIYTDTPKNLLRAAERNVLAHLIDLTERRIARPQGPLTAEAVFERI